MRLLGCAASLAALVALTVSPTASAEGEAPAPIEDYASYDAQTRCAKSPKPGTVALGDYVVATYGGGGGANNRDCHSGGASEHKDGRAIDWMMDARVRADRRAVRQFLREIFATDEYGNTHAVARRMGIMYLIWNDRMYSAWDEFEPEGYLSSSCPSKRKCSATLRHRNHVHISLSKPGARGVTSWYAGRV